MHPFRYAVAAAASLTIVAGCGTTHSGGVAPAGAPRAQVAAADSASAHGAAISFLAAFDSLQWEPFNAYLADDVTMFFPFPQIPGRVAGRDSVGGIFSQFMQAQRARRAQAGQPLVQGITPRDLRVQMAGSDAAVVSFHLGDEAPARRSLVFRRTGAGEWKVVHWHASPSPRPSGT